MDIAIKFWQYIFFGDEEGEFIVKGDKKRKWLKLGSICYFESYIFGEWEREKKNVS